MTSLKEIVREHYAGAARAVTARQKTSCCGSGGACAEDPISSGLYGEEATGLPENAMLASLGCGNPTLLAELRDGETVLDLGSGGGIDVLLSARRVGPSGKAFGLDMTDEMLALANANKAGAGAANVEFLKGEIENSPLPDASVDVILSNCVINLSTDKPRVLREAFRVLKPGGRLAVADIVRRGEISEEVARDAALWAGCIAGALEIGEYERLLAAAGFVGIDIAPERIYERGDGHFLSAFVRAVKP